MLDFFNKLLSEYSFIFAAIIIGLIVTIEDFKIDKIRNKWIKLGFIIGLGIYLAQIIYLILTHQIIELQIYWVLFMDTLIAFVLSFALWYIKLWAGGDAKLFTLFVFLIPATFYSGWYFIYWPPLSLLINITMPIFIYLLFKFLLYPFQLLINYIKKPYLIAVYYKNYKSQHKLDKTKIKDYLNAALSFIIILIFFQLLRGRLSELLNPYLGSLMIAFYFFMGFIVFQPLRALFQKRIILVLGLVIIYFTTGFIFFRDSVYNDLHRIIALQFIFMLSYYYIFKYGQALIMFLYNSAEVKMIPVAELGPGVYISKDYIRKTLDTSTNLEEFQKSLEPILDKEEKEKFWELMKQKTKVTKNDKQRYAFASLLLNLRPETFGNLIKQVFRYKAQKKNDKETLDKVIEKLNEEQKAVLDNILNKTDEVKKFLKKIRGKLTAEQAIELKAMIQKRNEEVQNHGLPIIDKIILHKTFAFAPFMLLGVLITIFTKSSLIHVIYTYILHR